MSQSAAELNFRLHKRQGEAFQSDATELLYGGAAGGGKSHLMRTAAVVWCAEIPGLQVYLFRRISEDLVKNHIEGKNGLRSILAPWSRAKLCTIVEDEIRFWNGSKIYLCHCKDEKDRFKYLGAEMHVLLIDELTTFTDVIYRFLRSRVRAVGLAVPEKYKGKFPRILAGSNPGNVGHHWVKSGFIDSALPYQIHRTKDEDGGMMRQFIPALLQDNPSMQEDDPTYRQRLRGLGSPELVKAMENGDWNVVAGAFFPEFTAQDHVLHRFEAPGHWLRFRAFDWGSYRPFSVGWYAVVSEEFTWTTIGDHRVTVPRGAVIRYREWYGMEVGKPNVGLKLDSPTVATGIHERSVGERYAYSVADPAIFNHTDGPSTAERFADNGIVFLKADNNRLVGWDQCRARLKGFGEPMFFVTEDCAHFIRTFPALQHDDHKPEDVDTDGEDHAADEVRYALMSRPWKAATPLPYEAPRGAIAIQEIVHRHESRQPDRRRI